MTKRAVSALAAAGLLAACASPSSTTTGPTPARPGPNAGPVSGPARPAGGAPNGMAPGDSAGRGTGAAQPRPYARVVTSDAQTRRGLFTVHKIDQRLLFEIPRKEWGKDMLLIGRYARAAAFDPATPGGGFGNYGGDQFGETTLRFDRVGNRIIVRA